VCGIGVNKIASSIALIAADYQPGLQPIKSLITTLEIQLGLILLVSLLGIIYVMTSLNNHIFLRLAKLQKFFDSLRSGVRHLRLSVAGNDEFALLARHINHTLDQEAEAVASWRSQIQRERSILLGALAKIPGEVAVYTLDGSLIASTFPADAQPALERASSEVSQLARRFASDPTGSATLEVLAGRRNQVQPLLSPNNSLLGLILIG
jgi:methyl-accepting chemotaxis protein